MNYDEALRKAYNTVEHRAKYPSVEDRMEDVRWLPQDVSQQDAALVSIAISLKRIADAFQSQTKS